MDGGDSYPADMLSNEINSVRLYFFTASMSCPQPRKEPVASHPQVLAPTASTGPSMDRATISDTPTGEFRTPSTPDSYRPSTLTVSTIVNTIINIYINKTLHIFIRWVKYDIFYVYYTYITPVLYIDLDDLGRASADHF